MPVKKNFRKKSVDKKQTKRIKELEQFVYKTIENKQINYQASNSNVTTTPVWQASFLRPRQGVRDGTGIDSLSRLGNSVTLMRQQLNFNFKMRTPSDEFNQMRLIICESTEGATSLVLTDILEYGDYALFGDMVFNSPYTTKTTTNRRYKIHADKKWTLTATHKPAVQINHVVKYKGGKVINFDGDDSVPTNHRLQFFVISDSGAVQHPRMDYSVRSTYKDA